MNHSDLLNRVREDNVKYISLQFTDVTGAVKSVDMPSSRLQSALDDGVWFDGSSVEGFARIQESDMRLVIDPATYVVLPWSPADLRRGRVFCDIFQPDGAPFAGDPRGTLKRMLQKVEPRGWTYNVGPEPEFFLFKRNGVESIHPVPHDVGGYFDFSASDEAVRVRTELMDALISMGLEVEMGHHEVALGQHEMDFRFADAMKTADNVLTLKYTVKAIAAQHDLVASFMPKPIYEEAEVCNRIAIIDHGRIIAVGSPEELKKTVGGDVIYIKTADTRKARTEIERLFSVAVNEKESELFLTTLSGDACIPDIIRALGDTVLSVRLQRPTLNDVFLHITGREIRGEDVSSGDTLREEVRSYRRRFDRG